MIVDLKISQICIVVILFCVTNAFEESTNSTGISSRIVGGQITTVAKVQYIVQLRDNHGTQWCSGTLVTRRHVVTAAHCIDFVNPIKDLVVVGGVGTLSQKGVKRAIVDYHKPKLYNRATFNMDYAVLKLESPMTGTNINFIPIRAKPLPPGTKIQVSGWGRTKSYGKKSEQLKTMFLPVISMQECRKTFHLTNTMFCAATPNKGPCQYDSGGPAVYEGKLVGIVSWGKENCVYSEGVPAIYTSTAAILPYIKKALQKLK